MRAVVFDYGMVLTGAPDPAAYAAMLQLTGLSPQQFEHYYWGADRHAYDEGKITGLEYWQKVATDARLNLDKAAIEQLNQWDAKHWTTEDPAMLAWQLALKEQGLLTAILSNMGDAVHASVERSFPWIHRFDVQVWSYQLLLAKPDPAIFLHTLERLGTRPEETLFLDDRRVNIEAAQSLGIQAIEFTTVEHLRNDLIVKGLNAELPLP